MSNLWMVKSKIEGELPRFGGWNSDVNSKNHIFLDDDPFTNYVDVRPGHQREKSGLIPTCGVFCDGYNHGDTIEVLPW